MGDLLQWRVLWKLDVICSDSGSQRMTTWWLLSYRSAAEGRVVQLLCWGVVPGHRLACWWGHFPFGEMVHEAGWSTSFPWRTPLLAASTHMGFCSTCSDRRACAVPQQALQGWAALDVKEGTSNTCQGVTVGSSSLFPWTEHSLRPEAQLKSGLI